MQFRPDLSADDVTPRALWLKRRQLIAGGLAAGSIAMAGAARADGYSTDEPENSFEEITSYNNYYEFGTSKEAPSKNAGRLTTGNWTVEIGGLVDKPGTYALADLLKEQKVEDRIYRLRCVEAWSMVIPWRGFQLSGLLDKVGVQSGAKYVAFETVLRPSEMPGVSFPVLDWPYVEGLRLDEARNPLTLMVTGLYGKDLPKQNGAPIRLVTPWKYGFKSIKAIDKITLVSDEPPTSWNKAAPGEYGFYANVNPNVDHPRWSQATEQRIGGGLFAKRIPTQMFNGYGDYVADLYAGMDLKKYY